MTEIYLAITNSAPHPGAILDQAHLHKKPATMNLTLKLFKFCPQIQNEKSITLNEVNQNATGFA